MLWSECDTFNYICNVVSKTSAWRCPDYCPEQTGENIINKNTS